MAASRDRREHRRRIGKIQQLFLKAGRLNLACGFSKIARRFESDAYLSDNAIDYETNAEAGHSTRVILLPISCKQAANGNLNLVFLGDS